MANSPLLDIPLLSDRQAGAETTTNTALEYLEAVVAARVVDRDLTAPPGSPADGALYIVGPSATGGWAGKDNNLALNLSGSWVFITPQEGLRVYAVDEDAALIWDGTRWAAIGGRIALTDGATIDWDTADGTNVHVTLAGNRTMNAPTNLRAGQLYTLEVIQDGTGSRTVTWNAVFLWAAGTAPTLTSAGGARDLLMFVYNGTSLLELSRTLNVS